MTYFTLVVPVRDFAAFEEYCFIHRIYFILSPLHNKNPIFPHYHILLYFSKCFDIISVRQLFVDYFEHFATVPDGLNKICVIHHFTNFLFYIRRID